MKLCGIVEQYRRMSAGFIILALFALFPDVALSQQTLVVDGSDKRGWVFNARPDINQSGEAPIRGMGDHAGGNASLNFSTTLGSDSSRGVRLARSDFPTSMSTIFHAQRSHQHELVCEPQHLGSLPQDRHMG